MQTPQTYKKAQGQAKRGDTNYCSVVALAYTMNWHFQRANSYLQKEAGRSHGGGPEYLKWKASLEKLGFEIVYHWNTDAVNKTGLRTLRAFETKKPKGKYIVYTASARSGHATGIVDGVIQDWTAGKGSRGNLRHCKIIFKMREA